MKILSVVGARPQFIKCAPVSRELRKEHTEILVHTGQHYDPEMSDIFFKELQIPKPDYNLGVGSGSHGKQTSEILVRMEDVLVKEMPDVVIVYGDTNTTLAGALAAAKLHIPVAHVEAGLRSFDRTMPEEINRVLTDYLSEILFCPTPTAVDNLRDEGITRGVHLVGDVMVDALDFNSKIADENSTIIKRLRIIPKKYLALTVHRPANTDDRNNMKKIFQAVGKARMPVVFPVHPRTKNVLEEYGMWNRLPKNVIVVDPLGYLDMLKLMQHAHKILTDSGGVQKEAYLLGIPCVTLRKNTEWVETLNGEWNMLAGVTPKKIIHGISSLEPQSARQDFFGKFASKKIVEILSRGKK